MHKVLRFTKPLNVVEDEYARVMAQYPYKFTTEIYIHLHVICIKERAHSLLVHDFPQVKATTSYNDTGTDETK